MIMPSAKPRTNYAEEALDSFHEYREAKRKKKDTVD